MTPRELWLSPIINTNVTSYNNALTVICREPHLVFDSTRDQRPGFSLLEAIVSSFSKNWRNNERVDVMLVNLAEWYKLLDELSSKVYFTEISVDSGEHVLAAIVLTPIGEVKVMWNGAT